MVVMRMIVGDSGGDENGHDNDNDGMMVVVINRMTIYLTGAQAKINPDLIFIPSD
jgi:hypothetical protein